MAYLGEHLYQCSAVPFDWKNAQLVIVRGSGPNFCVHALATAGSYYFHIDGLHDCPWYMGHTGYTRYLKEKSESFAGRGFTSPVPRERSGNWRS